MASSSTSTNPSTSTSSLEPAAQQPPDLKVNLIYPCTEKHIKKYSQQLLRTVNETPQMYEKYVRPYVEKQRVDGRLDWIFNILEGRTEQEDVFYRSTAPNKDERFLILPDLNWDRKTLLNLHVLALVERRDVWSLRDLTYSHIPWLKHMRDEILAATHKLYPDIETDQLKLYVHYQPTYYHFHVHVVHVMFEAGATQAVGKAFGLENLIGQLEGMGEGKGMKDVSLSYHLGEASDLWTEVFEPLKEGTLA
jgi:m7GpppX diphosphatase